MSNIAVKICGLKTPEHLDLLGRLGARYAGFNFFETSPRYVALPEARSLAQEAPIGLAKVGLVVNADDAFLDALTETVPLDMLQLHGKESPTRVSAVKARYGLPVMKVVGVADAEDVAQIDLYEPVADQIMVDAKPPKNAVLPGGNGIAFDWRLVANRRWTKPWMLAGGLTPDNVAEAVALTGTRQVDLASGVESAPGVKDPDKIAAFFDALKD